VSPSGREEAQYKRAYCDGLESLLRGLRVVGQTPRRLLFASSTAVYAQAGGEWINEDSPTEPEHFRGRRLLEGEALAQRAPSRSIVVRFGGIYGPRRTGLIDRVRTGQATYRDDPPHYSNRIHRDDCAGALRHLMQIEDPAPLYLGVDGEPADEKTVSFWLAGAIGSPKPRRVEKRERGADAPGSKRCRNRRLVQSGYTFRYPSFREGYRAVLQQII
jgi:nucleoside-diphosphate-sugar epimerase